MNNITFEIKVDRRFLQNNAYMYKLVPFVEDVRTKEIFYSGTSTSSTSITDGTNTTSTNASSERDRDSTHGSQLNLSFKKKKNEPAKAESRNAATTTATSSPASSPSETFVTNDPYNKLTASISKDLFKNDSQFRLIVQAVPCFGGTNLIVFGASQIIT